jgi:nucleoside-diphosphate-sugar epimerase
MTYNSGLDAVIARLFTFFGDKLDDGKAFTQFFQSARAGEPLKVYGDGSTIRSYMHGRDLGRVMWEILFNGDSMQAYDVGSDRPTTIKRLAERVSVFTGAKIEYVQGDNPVPVYLPNEERRWKYSLR